MTDNQQKGYYFEVDFKYPQKLHNTHLDFPYCPKNILSEEELPNLPATLYDKNNSTTRYCGTGYDLVVQRCTYLDWVYQVPIIHVGNGAGLY